VVSFSSSSGTSGNDNNTISYCDIGPSGANLPYSCIRSYATNVKGNDNIIISNNSIHDFFHGTVSGNINSNGIYIVTYASGWTISDNRFYQTATRTFSVGGQASYRTIRISTPSDVNSGNFNIINNIIGYANSAGMGTTTINVSDNYAVEFETIILEGGSNGALSTISGNTITNIDFTTARAPSSSGLLSQAFFGIYVDNCLASITNNIIGTVSGAGSIIIRSRQITESNSTGVAGIVSRGTKAHTITGNTIGGITILKYSSSSTIKQTMGFVGIKKEGTVNPTIILSNTIGNPTANNITSDQSKANIIGIYCTASPTTISSNIIQNLTHSGPNTNAGSFASVIGILNNTTSVSGDFISGNQLIALKNSAVTFSPVEVRGIYWNASTTSSVTIEKNLIADFWIKSSSNSSLIAGITALSNNYNLYNNMICLGDTGAVNAIVRGIYQAGGSVTSYYNSTRIMGLANTGSGTSAAYYLANSGVLTSKNNILANERTSTGGNPKNYAIYFAGTFTYTGTNNNLYVTGIAGILGYASGDKITLGDWYLATGQDNSSDGILASISQSMVFVSSTDLHILDATSCNGGIPVSVIVDYDNEMRNPTIPDIGADEFGNAVWQGITSTDWNNASSWLPTVVPIGTTDVIIPGGVCTISSANATCQSITINALASLSMTNNTLLTISEGCAEGAFNVIGSFSAGNSLEEVAFDGKAAITGTVTFNIVSTNDSLTFSTATSINKVFRLDAGGCVKVNAPYYTVGSATLQYNTASTFYRGLEWSANTGAGYPYNVQISNNTILDLGNGAPEIARQCGGDLTIDAGSTLTMNNGADQMTNDLIVLGEIILNGTLTQSSLNVAPFNDIIINGNWTHGVTGSYNPNTRLVSFNGTTTQTIAVSGGGAETFYDLEVNNGVGIDLATLTNVNVMHNLYLTAGIISTGTSEVFVQNYETVAISYPASNSTASSWINGNLRRKTIAGNYAFPIGTGTYYELANIDFSQNTNIDNLLSSFTQDASTTNEPYSCMVDGTPITDRLNAGWWTFTPYDASLNEVSSPSCSYNITLYERGHTNSQADPMMYSVIKRANCTDACALPWDQCGVHTNSTQSEAGGTAIAARTGYTCNSFSDFAIGFGIFILPIELTDFAVELVNNNAVLMWQTSAEYNSDLFVIERSLDGLSFEGSAVLDASGFSSEPINYSFIDSFVKEFGGEKVFYRLRMVDLDQSFTYSPVRWVVFTENSLTNSIAIFPNPFNSELSVLIASKNNQHVIVQMTDFAGKLIRESSLQLTDGTDYISFISGDLPSGIYFIKVNFYHFPIVIKAMKQ
jgi:hypothetical protein